MAACTGFSDQSRFSRHFKRVVGVTPGQFQTPEKNRRGRSQADMARRWSLALEEAQRQPVSLQGVKAPRGGTLALPAQVGQVQPRGRLAWVDAGMRSRAEGDGRSDANKMKDRCSLPDPPRDCRSPEVASACRPDAR